MTILLRQITAKMTAIIRAKLQTRKVKTVETRAQATKPQGFFDWLFSLFRGR